MDPVVEVQVKLIYGTKRIYPINETALKLADLLGRKTFTEGDVAKLKAIGFVMKWVPVTI